MALLLGGSAGYLDAVGYLTLGLFTANMTGNTVLLGIFCGEGRWGAAGRALLALALFFAGATLAGVAARRQTRLAGVLTVEAAVLLAGLAYWVVVLGRLRGTVEVPGAFALIALFSVAMGIQSAAVRRVGEHRVSTTYVTGTLTSLATDLAADLLTGARRSQDGAGRARDGGTALLAGVWGSYLAGALAGGFAEFRWSLWAVAAPVAVLAGMAIWDLRGAAAAEAR
ncbi:MAG TPA: YoaK family protein [bacterium]|nr:YoaK family protein [bacterium]